MAKDVHGFMRLVPSTEGPMAAMKEKEKGEGDEDEASSVATDVGVDEFVGVRIPCPVYKTPVIPYLQTAYNASVAGGGSGGETSLALRDSGKDQPEPESENHQPFVIMPDVSFQLKNNLGTADFGAVNISLQNFVGPENYRGAW